MKITNNYNRPREIAATGQVVDPGDTVDVDDDLGESLCEQPANWSAAKPVKSSKAASAKSEED